MNTYVALLRAINVGGTGKLAMSELRSQCMDLGFTDVATFIQSGNVVFRSRLGAQKVQAMLEAALEEKLGKPVGVFLRTAEDLEALDSANPFKEAAPAQLLVVFLAAPPPKGAVEGLEGPDGERVAARGREVFIHYPKGMGRSKLKVPIAKDGTGRNLNSVRKLAALARKVEGGG